MQQGKYFRIQEEIHLGENMLKNKIKSQEKKYSSAFMISSGGNEIFLFINISQEISIAFTLMTLGHVQKTFN